MELVCWRHFTPSQTVPTLIEALAPHAQELLQSAAFFRSGPQGVRFTLLEMWPHRALLGKLTKIDPRGAVMAQSDMESAMNVIFAIEDLALELEEAAKNNDCSVAELKGAFSFRIREMAQSIRRKLKYRETGAEDGWDEVFAPMAQHWSIYGRCRTVGSFFSNFSFEAGASEDGAETEDEDDDEDDEGAGATASAAPPPAISHYYDGKEHAAYKLYSNGDKVPATVYEAGGDGFVRAFWEDATLKLQIPNSCLRDGALHAFKPPPQARPARKRPAALMAQDVDAADGDGGKETDEEDPSEKEQQEQNPEEEEDAGDAAAEPHLWPTRGHENNHCLFLRTTHADKIQVLEVTPRKVAESSVTPRQVCAHLAGAQHCQEMVAALGLGGDQTVKKLDKKIVSEVRKMLRQWADEFVKSKK